jgi:mRNA-degrading endonuclease RelE of RelBE toxin-antitoxin system
VITTEILRELLRLSPTERRAILNRLIELDEDAEVLDERRSGADEAFQRLDAMETDAVLVGRTTIVRTKLRAPN